MIVTTFDLSICLKIETEKKLDDITEVLYIEPTDVIRKGERKSKVLEMSECNIWMYDKKYNGWENKKGIFDEFLKCIPELLIKIEELKKIGTVTIRISVISDYAQMGFTFNEKDLELMSMLQIPIEISIFSWGKCIC